MICLSAAPLKVAAGLLAALAVVPALAQGGKVALTLEHANEALQAGEADKALAEINSLPESGAQMAEAKNLECRVRFTLQQWDPAVSACQQAVNLDGQNFSYHLWLARALGQKASNASFLSAYSLAKQVLVQFETAARQNPHSADALSDLGDFYREAPGMLGGGLDKASNVAAQLDKIDPARAAGLRGHIAEGRSDYGTAEREFKQAISVAAHPALYWTTLASFYKGRKQWADLDGAIHNGESAADRDKHAAVALYDGAGVLIESKRNPALAAKLLMDYLASPYKTEDGPAAEAHVRLAKLKKQMGDAPGAQKEVAAALALAHDYKPALDFKL